MWRMEQSRHVWQKCTWANHFLVFTGKEAAPWGAHIWSKEEFLLHKYHQNHRTKSTNDDICIFSGQPAYSPLLLMRTTPTKVYTKFKQRPSVIFQIFTFFHADMQGWSTFSHLFSLMLPPWPEPLQTLFWTSEHLKRPQNSEHQVNVILIGAVFTSAISEMIKGVQCKKRWILYSCMPAENKCYQ